MAKVYSSTVVVWKPGGLEKVTHMKALAFLHVAGGQLTAEAKIRCPVDLGRLRSSITYQVDSEKLSMRYGSNVEYAWYQENGTSRGVPARRYLRGALEAKKEGLMKLWKFT